MQRTRKDEVVSVTLVDLFIKDDIICWFISLLVWAITGIAILVGWSIPMNYLLAEPFTNNAQSLVDIIFGVLLVISGLYQFSPLKTKCLGYCESPISFFMRRWRSGTVGAMKMGVYHGLYCLGCCWPYFLLMVALGWMEFVMDGFV